MPDRLTDDRLRQLATDPGVCVDHAHRSMAAELLAARAQLAQVRALATAWAGQTADHDGDTGQQIADGRALLAVLDVAVADEPVHLCVSCRCGVVADWYRDPDGDVWHGHCFAQWCEQWWGEHHQAEGRGADA